MSEITMTGVNPRHEGDCRALALPERSGSRRRRDREPQGRGGLAFMKPSIRVVIAALLTAGFVAMADAQELGPTPPVLREAQPGEVWITQPTMSAALPIPASEPGGVRAFATDSTPPTAPGNLVAQSTGLFLISANWSPSTDPESAIDYYAFALGTGTTPDTEANVRWWQSNGRDTKVKINLALTQGSTYYFSVRARNGAGLI